MRCSQSLLAFLQVCGEGLSPGSQPLAPHGTQERLMVRHMQGKRLDVPPPKLKQAFLVEKSCPQENCGAGVPVGC